VRYEAGHPVAPKSGREDEGGLEGGNFPPNRTDKSKDRGGTGPVKFIAGPDLLGPPTEV